MDTAGHPDSDWLIRIIGLAVYAAALSLTVILPKYTRLPMKPFSLGVDAAAVLITGLLPSDLNDFIALYPLFFAMAIQWCSFPGLTAILHPVFFQQTISVSSLHL